MANVQISQLPAAGAITGTELVPVVQNGVTVQTTTGAIAASPSQTQTFLTKNQEPSLPNSRYLSTDTGLAITDGGAQSFLRLSLNGASGSLESASTGMIAKTSSTTVASRTLSTSGLGLSVTNGDGISGNPTFQLTGVAAAVAAASGTGMLAIVGGTTIAGRQILGTANQINVANGDGSNSPVISIVSDPTIPGTGGMTIPKGTIGQQPAGVTGQIRYNTTSGLFEGFTAGTWLSFSQGNGVLTFDGGTTGLTPVLPTNGAVSLGGTLVVANGGTGATTLSGYLKGNGTSAFTGVATIPNTDITGLGTMSTQSANNVAITGGTISGLSAPIAVASGGTGASTLTGYVKGAGTSALTASATIPNTDITGLGTMSTQSASFVAISGGAINGTTVGAITPAAGTFTTVNATSGTLGSVALTTGTITTAPSGGNDIVNKTYADALASGLSFHEACRLATTAALPANTYNNGAFGVGATLTANANGALSVDSTLTVAGNRILVKNEAAPANNGVYVVTQVGTAGTPYILTRATDFNTPGTGVNQINAGDFFLITAGTANANTSWVQQTPLPITVGITSIVFQQFGAPITYSAGTGLTESPFYTFNIGNTGVTANTYGSASSVPQVIVNAQGQITSASSVAIAIAASQITSGTLPVANGGTGRTVGNYSIYANEIHVGKDGNDTTGDGTLINPVLTITKALTLIGAGRNTVVVHPGSYSESPTVTSANTTIATSELTGANTQIAGTLTLSAAARVSGIKLTNLTITGSGNTYISNCTVDTQVVKSGSNYVEIINTELQCVSGVQITGAGIVSIVGNKCWAVAVSNASANVLIKDCYQVLTPSVTAGTLQIDGSAIFAASPASNAVTSSAGSFITLANSFVLNSAGTNVERVSLAGSYSILNLVYDKTNSTFTGTNLNAIDYFSVINTESLVSSGTITAANYVGISGGNF